MPTGRQVPNNSLPTERSLPPGIGERAFTVLILLMSTGAFASLTTVQGRAADEPGIAGKLVAGSIYLITYLLLARHCGFWSTIWRGRWVMALIAFAVLSAFWSVDPTLSFRKGISMAGSALFGLYFASRYSLSEQIKLLARMCGIAMVCSLVFGLLGLGHAVDKVEGWFGIYVQKNELGKIAVLSVLVFWYLGKTDARAKWAARAGILLSLLLILLSNSTTALIVFSLLFPLQILLLAFRHGKRLGVMLLTLGLVVGAAGLSWALTHPQAVAAAMGKNTTLSGRIPLWIFSVFMALQRPWLGYGYFAFWGGMNGPSSRILVALNIGMPHAHNGFIDLWLALGIVGLAIFSIGFLIYLRRSLSFVEWHSPASSWPLMFLAFIVLYNLTESTLLVPNSLYFALYVAAAISVSARSESSPVRLPLGERQIAYGQ